jgi:hypothetical protein
MAQVHDESRTAPYLSRFLDESVHHAGSVA